MGAMTSQITSLTIVYSTVYSGPDQRKHQSSASLAFARGIRRWPVNSPHKWPVTQKMFHHESIMIFNKLITNFGNGFPPLKLSLLLTLEFCCSWLCVGHNVRVIRSYRQCQTTILAATPKFLWFHMNYFIHVQLIFRFVDCNMCADM